MSTGKTKKKVLFTSHVANFQKFNRPFMRWFRENGWEVHYASAGEEDILDCDKEFKVPFERSPFKLNNFKAYRQLKKIIDDGSYDIIHTHTPVGSVVTRLAARQARRRGTRVIYTAHGFHFFKGAPLINWLIYYPTEKLMARHTDTLVTINKEDYERAKQNFKTNVQYVPGVGVDLHKYMPVGGISEKNRLRKKYGFDKSDFILICVAELNKNKNQESIIKNMQGIIKSIPKAKLMFCGVGEQEQHLRGLTEKLGLTNNVKFMGYRNDLNSLYSVSDVAVSFSKREGQGLGVIESMASSLPVVVSNNRGHRDIVKNGKNGYFVDIDNSNALTKQLKKLHDDKDLRNKLSIAARKSVEKYSLDNIMTDMVSVYVN